MAFLECRFGILAIGDVPHGDDGPQLVPEGIYDRLTANEEGAMLVMFWGDDHFHILNGFPTKSPKQRNLVHRHQGPVWSIYTVMLGPLFRRDGAFGESTIFSGGAIKQGNHAVGVTTDNAIGEVIQHGIEEFPFFL